MKTIVQQLHKRLPAMALASAVVFAGTALAFTTNSTSNIQPRPAIPKVAVDETSVSRGSPPRATFAAIVKKVGPGVVKVETTMTMKRVSMQQIPDFNDPSFGDRFGQMVPRGPQREHGLGSGVIVTKDGYILTNNHVVDNASEVKVTLEDGREFTAKVIGRDQKSDIAVVKIEAKDLPAVPMADSDKVEVGDVVLAIGNPFGVGQTVTQGIVSAKNRGNMGMEDYEDFIQTDAAINPGNSGGALVDVEGRLIGINTAILSRSGGSQGLGFAIPSDLARGVMESLVQYGHVTRGYLGVMIQDVTPTLAKEFKLKGSTGAVVGDVVPDGPGAKAGIKDGDVVLEFNGKSVADSRQLRLNAAETKPGSSVPVKVWRDGSAKTLEVVVAQLPGTEQLAENNKETDTGTLNGVGVSNLDPEMRQQFNLPETVKGAVITEVKPDSASADAGLKAGDVIEEINRHPVSGADDAVRLTENAKDRHTLVRVWENGGSHYIVVDESNHTG